MTYLRVYIALEDTLSKTVGSGWTPRWATNEKVPKDLGPAQVTFMDGAMASPGDSAMAIICPLSPKSWKQRPGETVLLMAGTEKIGVADVLEVFL